MQTSDAATLALLQSLLRICADSVEGYLTAARDTADPEITQVLMHYRNERAKIASEIEHRLTELRGQPNPTATAFGAAHRVWMDVWSGTASNRTEAVLAEVERGEDVAVRAFRQALAQADLDGITRRQLERHYEAIQGAHDRIKQLRDRGNYARGD